MTAGDRPACRWCQHPAQSHWEAAEPSGPRAGCGLLGCECPRLLDLRHTFGYFTRAELGLDPPRGHWTCPGRFGEDGAWQPCCGPETAP